MLKITRMALPKVPAFRGPSAALAVKPHRYRSRARSPRAASCTRATLAAIDATLRAHPWRHTATVSGIFIPYCLQPTWMLYRVQLQLHRTHPYVVMDNAL